MAGPGHINFFLSYKYFSDLVNKIITENNNFGETQEGKNISINNVFFLFIINKIELNLLAGRD